MSATTATTARRTAEIAAVAGRAVYDSNGSATIEAEVSLRDGTTAVALAQRGSTKGDYEASVLEREELQPSLEAVAPALQALREVVAPALVGLDAADQPEVDRTLDALDPTEARTAIGGNTSIAVSMATALAGARSRGAPLFRHLAPSARSHTVPTPIFNVIDGAVEASSAVPHVEFVLIPARALTVAAALTMGARVRSAARAILRERGVVVGDSAQGALYAALGSCEEGLELLTAAAAACGYAPEREYTLGLDLAASDVYDGRSYRFGWGADGGLTADELVDRYCGWTSRYPLSYLEDGFASTDEPPFARLRERLPGDVLVAGDDLFASSAERIRSGAKRGLASAAVVKPNQIGTVSGALAALAAAAECGLTSLVSQRSGESGDALISHLAVAGGATYLKAGGVARMDRVAKLNELLRIAG